MAARIFPGWWVVAAVFIVLSAASGLIFYGLAVYLDAITDEQPFSTTSVSLATSVFFIVAGVAGRVIAPIIETRDIRLVIALGAVLGGASLAVLGTVDSLVELYTVYVVLALGFAMAGVLPATTLVTRWFHGRRALALAIASTGLSVGGLTYTQFAAWLIGDRSLADAAPILGLVYVISILATLPLLVPSRPTGARARRRRERCERRRSTASTTTPPSAPVSSLSCSSASSWQWAPKSAASPRSRTSAERADSSTGALAVSAIAVGARSGASSGASSPTASRW